MKFTNKIFKESCMVNRSKEIKIPRWTKLMNDKVLNNPISF